MTTAVLVCFFGFVLLPSLVCHPLVYAILKRPGLAPLSVATGLTGYLVVFSLLAREIPGYLVTLPLSFVVFAALCAVGLWFLRRGEKVAQGWSAFLAEAFAPSRVGLVLTFAGSALFIGLLLLRLSFSQTFFDAGRFGAEKLYNVQFIQSFLFADTWPPESPWFAGSPTGYYILPKALPGLVGHILHHVFGVFGSAGVLFHLNDVFFISLGPVVLMTLCVFLLGTTRRAVTVSIAMGLVPLLGAPARALSQAFKGNIDLWALTRVVEDTINEYPFWNYLWADNHSHSSALFVQLAFLTWFLAFLLAAPARRTAAALVGGVMAAGLVLAHSGSVFIDLIVCGAIGAATLLQSVRDKTWKAFLGDVSVFVATAAVVTLPDLATRGQPGVRWYFVPAQNTTGFVDFFNIYFTQLIVVALFAGVALSPWSGGRFGRAQATELFLSMFGAVVLAVLGRPSWGVAFFAFNAMRVALVSNDADTVQDERFPRIPTAVRIGGCIAVFLLLFTPEIVASNFDMGEKYMRYNTLFRFLFESYSLVPALTCLALGGVLLRALDAKALRYGLGALTIAFAALLVFVQALTSEKRITSVAAAGPLDGLAWHQKDHPEDAGIVRYLESDPRPQLRIIEECAIAPKPSAYTMLSRISALSGRPALCGWSNHVLLFQKGVRHPDHAGKSTWDLLQERERWSQQLYGLKDLDAATQKGLKDFGITHLVFGEEEQKLHPEVTLDALGRYGTVVFRQGDLGVVELTAATK